MIVTAIIYDENDNPLTVTGEFSPPCRGSRDKYGVQMEPDTEATMDTLTIVDANGDEIPMTDVNVAKGNDALWEAMECE